MSAARTGGGSSPSGQAIRARNWRLVQIDSVFIGMVTASSTFLPVFLLRLGASANDVGLLTALPALTAFLLAIPLGRVAQRRRNVVPWYSRLRLVAWSSYAVMAAVAVVVPRDQAISILLVVWGLASLPSTAALVVFPIVMDGVAGKDGRFDLLGRRWAIAGLSTAVSVVIGGQFLNAVAFPMNFELLLVFVSIAGVGSFLQSNRFVIPDQVPRPNAAAETPRRERVLAATRLVTSNRPFIGFELRTLVYICSLGLAMPLLPLFYVHEVAASDAWIGVIGAAGSAGAVLGYLGARQLARRRGAGMILLPSLLAMAVIPAVLSFVAWLPLVAALAFVMGVAQAGAQLALFDTFFRKISSDHAVTFSSVDQSIQNFGLIVAPNVGGLIAVALDARAALLVVSAVGFAAFGLFALEVRGRRANAGSSASPVPA